MLAATIKNVLMILSEASARSSVTLKTVGIGADVGTDYTFEISNGSLRYTIFTNDLEISQYCSDIEMLRLPKLLKPIYWEHITFATDGSVYETTTVPIRYEANLFIKLFRIMSERSSFTMKFQGKVVQAYYFEGKVHYVTEEDGNLIVNITTLYSLFKHDNNYHVLAVNRVPANLDVKSWLRKQEDRALRLGMNYRVSRENREVAQYAKV